jgi:hypothetical protein
MIKVVCDFLKDGGDIIKWEDADGLFPPALPSEGEIICRGHRYLHRSRSVLCEIRQHNVVAG